MKKLFIFTVITAFFAAPCAAQSTQQLLNQFRSAQDPQTTFAAAARLVENPPEKVYEPALLNQIISAEDPLKMAFSAIILTAMGSAYQELTPLLQDTLQTSDPILRAYGAGAYGLVNPSDKTHTTDVVRLYIFDPAFAQRAMNMLTANDHEQFNILKKACAVQDPQVRGAAVAWLGSLHTPQALALLTKRAKKETEATVQTQLAVALAAHPDVTLPQATEGLKLNYKKPAATTYALTLGFMTGHSVSALKTALLSTDKNQRINALRATAYMAGVLSNPDGFSYTSDRAFDTHLLKGLIPQITALAKNGTADEQTYAQNALSQIEKLM